MTERAINFSAGPAGLPRAVMLRAQAEFLDFDGTGMGVIEQSHRGEAYDRVHRDAEARLRALLGLDDAWAVLFLQGGASQCFATVPMNLLRPGQVGAYAVTGGWGDKALAEARTVGEAVDVTPMGGRYDHIPLAEAHRLPERAAYLHITTNNTLEGTQYAVPPTVEGAPLVADMSSDFLWRPTDLSPYGLVYAGAQKNLGPSGLVVVVARRALLSQCRTDIPRIFRFGVHDANGSLYNTPNTFGVYMLRLVLAWIEEEGGLAAIARRNEAKAAALYAALDGAAGFYSVPARPGSRSAMNVVYRLPDAALEARYLEGAAALGMVGLQGHRSVGGLRASLYNAVSEADAEALAGYTRDFARRWG